VSAAADYGMSRFKGIGAVVTGGASGIGVAAVERIIAEGGRVSIWDADPSGLDAARRKFGDDVDVVLLDVRNPESVRLAAAAADASLGGIQALVCCAGVAGPSAAAVDYDIAEWQRVLDINLNGLYYCNRYVGSAMMARGYGRIVNISSIAGKEGNPMASAYSASKAAVIGFTKSFAKEIAKTGVIVNSLAPAIIETPLLRELSSEVIASARGKIPMDRFGSVTEAAAIICWLASAECSFTTGAVFDFSGGRATY
jgi:3-oxoacyl-[acyl-carrier protein] reductase